MPQRTESKDANLQTYMKIGVAKVEHIEGHDKFETREDGFEGKMQITGSVSCKELPELGKGCICVN
eukprot:10471251-Ditylum_brightwellii.AAC.1